MTDTNFRFNQHYTLGFTAGKNGAAKSTNPHTANTAEYWAWAEGFETALESYPRSTAHEELGALVDACQHKTIISLVIIVALLVLSFFFF